MKTIITPRSFPVVGVAALSFLLAFAGQASGQLININFNSASDLNDFSLRTGGAVDSTTGAPNSTALQFNSAAGLGGSGGLLRSGDVTAVYQPLVFDLSVNTTFTLSMFFRTGTNLNNATGNVLQLGFLANNNLAFNGDSGNAFISIRLNDDDNTSANVTLQSQHKLASSGVTTGSATADGKFTLEQNNWYLLTGTLTKLETANTFSFSVNVENWGSDGSAMVPSSTVPSFAGTFTNSGIYNDSSVYAGFRLASAAVAAVDNFTVVPEPSTAVMLIGGVGLMGIMRRRRSS